MSAPAAVTLYTTRDCPPCTAARGELERLAPVLGFSLAVVDIGSDPGLEQEYRWSVPVVVADGREIARAPIRSGTLEARLRDAMTAPR